MNLPELPRDKFDLVRARALVELGYPAVAPVLDGMLEWVQDSNWPVASVLHPLLIAIGMPLVPHLLHVLRTDDDTWKYFVIRDVIGPSPVLTAALRDELTRIANDPTPGERAEEAHEMALDALTASGL